MDELEVDLLDMASFLQSGVVSQTHLLWLEDLRYPVSK